MINNNQYHLNITLPTQSHWVAWKAFLIHISLLIMARFIEIKILISKTSLPSSKSMQIQAKFSGPGFCAVQPMPMHIIPDHQRNLHHQNHQHLHHILDSTSHCMNIINNDIQILILTQSSHHNSHHDHGFVPSKIILFTITFTQRFALTSDPKRSWPS